MTKISKLEFINRAQAIHGKCYDYSDINYVNTCLPIWIRCRIHGKFLQLPDNHTYGKCGCPKCATETRRKFNTKSSKKFILDAIKIHKTKYDYSKSIYKNAHAKLEIICPKHGSFFQNPNNHLNRRGCPRCNGNEARRLTTEEFIKRANKIHNFTYDYSKSNYKGRIYKIIIKCKLHGIFYQEPNSHLKGSGCPKCKKSKGEMAIENYLSSKKFLYETPKTFKTCINPKTGWNLYYDFYLSHKNILIEYDGYQHYLPYHRDKFNLDSLEERKYRDNLKTVWARRNNMRLVRIKYTAMKRIPEILRRCLGKA